MPQCPITERGAVRVSILPQDRGGKILDETLTLATMRRILFSVSRMLIGAMVDRLCWIEKEKLGACDRQPGPQAGGSWGVCVGGGEVTNKTRKV